MASSWAGYSSIPSGPLLKRNRLATVAPQTLSTHIYKCQWGKPDSYHEVTMTRLLYIFNGKINVTFECGRRGENAEKYWGYKKWYENRGKFLQRSPNPRSLTYARKLRKRSSTSQGPTGGRKGHSVTASKDMGDNVSILGNALLWTSRSLPSIALMMFDSACLCFNLRIW